MLRPLQQRLVSLITELPEAEGFALAGGAALVIRGEVHRTTSDLDFFATDAEAVGRLSEAVEKAAARAGLTCRRERAVLGFAQLEIADGDDVCRVDPAYDARIRPYSRWAARDRGAVECRGGWGMDAAWRSPSYRLAKETGYGRVLPADRAV